MTYSRLGQADWKSQLDEAIGYLEAAKTAADAWASNSCGGSSGGCSSDSQDADKQRCCVNSSSTEGSYPNRAKAAIEILSRIKEQATADAAVGAVFLSGYRTLTGYFGEPPNWNSSRYQSGSWENTSRILQAGIIDLKTARGSSSITMFAIIGVLILVGSAVAYYYFG